MTAVGQAVEQRRRHFSITDDLWYLIYVRPLTPANEGRAAGNDGKSLEAVEFSDQVLDHAIREAVLLGIAAQICKWQN